MKIQSILKTQLVTFFLTQNLVVGCSTQTTEKVPTAENEQRVAGINEAEADSIHSGVEPEECPSEPTVYSSDVSSSSDLLLAKGDYRTRKDGRCGIEGLNGCIDYPECEFVDAAGTKQKGHYYCDARAWCEWAPGGLKFACKPDTWGKFAECR